MLLGLFLSGPSLAGDAPALKFLLTWGKAGSQPGEFHSPIGIAIGPKDEVFVTDLNNSRMQRFDAEGKWIGGFDLPRDVPERMSCMAGGICLDDEGLIYLSFMIQHKIAVFDTTGRLVREWGRKGAEPGELNGPGGLRFARDGTLFVADQNNHRVQRFTKEGKFLGTWGSHGAEPGQFGGPEAVGSRFAGPHFLGLDSRNRLYTTEGALGRVQQLSLEGKPLLAWGNKGTQPGGFGEKRLGGMENTMGPVAVFVDREDRVWVSSLNHRVQAFTPEGKFLYGIAERGGEPGQLDYPHGMAQDSRGHFYVADSGNQRIQKFELPPAPTKSPPP